MIKCRFWITFWLQGPREYRETLISLDIGTRYAIEIPRSCVIHN